MFITETEMFVCLVLETKDIHLWSEHILHKYAFIFNRNHLLKTRWCREGVRSAETGEKNRGRELVPNSGLLHPIHP